MLKVGTLLVVLCIATSAFAQEASKKLQLEPSLKEQAMLLESSCDMNRTLLSYPETPPEDTKKYEFAPHFCLWTPH